MTKAPKIDHRTASDIAGETAKLAEGFSGWEPGDPAGLGEALTQVFGRYAEIIINRLNQAPDKNFLAFLNLIGVEPASPLPARVPLTFILAENSPQDALVPAGTQVAAPPLDGEEDEVTFETERDLVVTRSKLVRTLFLDPQVNKYRDVTTLVQAEKEGSIALFAVDADLTHEIYLASDQLLVQQNFVRIEITFTEEPTADLAWEWSYWAGEEAQWQPLISLPELRQGKTVTLRFENLPALQAHTMESITSGWLRAQQTPVMPLHKSQPRIEKIEMSFKAGGECPTAAFSETIPLDVSRDFYPFGENPQVGSTFFIACELLPLFAGKHIDIDIELRQAPNSSNTPEIVWEVADGRSWQEVLRAKSGPGAFLESGRFSLSLPDVVGKTAVNGQTDYWLRARLISGDYGRLAHLEQDPTSSGQIKLVDSNLHPPIVAGLTVSSQETTSTRPAACLRFDELQFEDMTAWINEQRPFTPFVSKTGVDPALYLGFDQPFANRPVSLYVELEAPSPEAVGPAQVQAATVAPRIVWEYLAEGGVWRNLGAVDETTAFANRGLVRFLAPPDWQQRPLFGQEHCWLRARLQSGSFALPPRIRRILLNTTWASQAITTQREILGSGSGEPGQTLRTAQTPVLPGCRVLVREPDLSPDALDGLDVTIDPDAAGEARDIWVTWPVVADFFASGPSDRHVVVDSRLGTVRFGDGQHGRLPPIGVNNIRITYRSGGGLRGNRAAGTITELKSSLPYVDSVTHYEASGGGSEEESLASVQRYGPRRLRHRDRAVAAQDIEDLAFAASSQVARAKAITPLFNPLTMPGGSPKAWRGRSQAGRAGLIIVPREEGRQPVPSLGLLEQVRSYLVQRMPAASDLWVSGPVWQAVAVEVTAVPRNIQEADVVQAGILAALDRFLHPLTGGERGTGWPFGRRPQESDIYGLLASVPGIDHILDLKINLAEVEESAGIPVLIYSGGHRVRLLAASQRQEA